jgi:hypothetical protein
MPRVSKKEKEKQAKAKEQEQSQEQNEAQTNDDGISISIEENTTELVKQKRRRVSKKADAITDTPHQTDIENTIVDTNTTENSNNKPISGYKFQPQMKNVENMERIKSKIEMFDSNKHKVLLPAILLTYGYNMDKTNANTPTHVNMISTSHTKDNDFEQSSHEFVIDEFKKQITQNQNGIFLNLTCCSDELWQACVQCVEQIEIQQSNIEKLDKERQMEMERIRNSQKLSSQ